MGNTVTINDFSKAAFLFFNKANINVTTNVKHCVFFRDSLLKQTIVRSGIRTHAGKTRLRPERSALDRSAILTRRFLLVYIDNSNRSFSFAACLKLFPSIKHFTADHCLMLVSFEHQITIFPFISY